MHRVRAAALLLLCAGIAAAEQVPPQIGVQEYTGRRQALRKQLRNSVLVLFGNNTRDVDELRTGFYQERNFYYLTGLREPGAILLMTTAREALFLPRRNEAVERYTGRHLAGDDSNAREATGFEQVLPLAAFESQLAKALEENETLLALKDRRQAASLERLAPLRQVTDCARMLGRARAKKSPAEIAWIQYATAVSVEAHRAAWARIAPGLYEYQVAATMLFPMLDHDCRQAYTPIVASGPNATVLHYASNTRRIDTGDVIVMDVAAACGDYASDITRTVPASGKFTPRQREIYEAVLGAQKAALDVLRPGATMQTINKAARDYLEAHGKLGRYLTHGISHGVGLEVHDFPVHTATEPLEAGMVITFEPGVYIPEEGIGVRIEDTVLITDAGAKVLSAALPKDPEEIEKAVGRELKP